MVVEKRQSQLLQLKANMVIQKPQVVMVERTSTAIIRKQAPGRD